MDVIHENDAAPETREEKDLLRRPGDFWTTRINNLKRFCLAVKFTVKHATLHWWTQSTNLLFPFCRNQRRKGLTQATLSVRIWIRIESLKRLCLKSDFRWSTTLFVGEDNLPICCFHFQNFMKKRTYSGGLVRVCVCVCLCVVFVRMWTRINNLKRLCLESNLWWSATTLYCRTILQLAVFILQLARKFWRRSTHSDSLVYVNWTNN